MGFKGFISRLSSGRSKQECSICDETLKVLETGNYCRMCKKSVCKTHSKCKIFLQKKYAEDNLRKARRVCDNCYSDHLSQVKKITRPSLNYSEISSSESATLFQQNNIKVQNDESSLTPETDDKNLCPMLSRKERDVDVRSRSSSYDVDKLLKEYTASKITRKSSFDVDELVEPNCGSPPIAQKSEDADQSSRYTNNSSSTMSTIIWKDDADFYPENRNLNRMRSNSDSAIQMSSDAFEGDDLFITDSNMHRSSSLNSSTDDVECHHGKAQGYWNDVLEDSSNRDIGDSSQMHLEIGMEMMKNENYVFAILELRKALSENELCKDALYYLSKCLLFTGDLEEAEEKCVCATEIAPNSPACWSLMAKIANTRGNYSFALESYKKCLGIVRQNEDEVEF